VNVNVLIDAVVRQTTVLIAQLATTAGARAPLAHTANQVFMNLVRELKEQGLGNKVIADMFGLTLRTYHNKIQRLSESSTDRGRSLWEAVLSYVQEAGPTSRADVLIRFRSDDVATVKGVLKDLVDTGLLYRTGRGDAITYRTASPSDFPTGPDDGSILAHLVWVAVHSRGSIDRDDLAEQVPADDAALDAALRHLIADQRLEVHEEDGKPIYSSRSLLIPIGSTAGWEAAVFDHYQALVTAICTKLHRGSKNSTPRDWIGGSTYHYDVWKGHPLHDEVVNLLASLRDEAHTLRQRVDEYNATHSPDEASAMRVVAYVGQTVRGPEPEEDGE
jgi:hypothetical protein